jgi:nucleotide-binding universal stress UspA family protein
MANITNGTGTQAGTTPAVDPTPTTNPNPLLADAQDKIAQLLTLAASFPEEPDQNSLTSTDLRLANATSVQFLERAAQLAEAVPVVGAAVDTNVTVLRNAVYSELAYGALVDQLTTLARQVGMAIISRKLKAVKVARSFYQVAKVYVNTEAGTPMKPHVQELKQTLQRKRKKAVKPAKAPTPATTGTAPAPASPTTVVPPAATQTIKA